MHLPSFRSALLPLAFVLAILLPSTVWAAETVNPAERLVESGTPESTAFARYIAGLEKSTPWTSETIEIEASLPKLAEHGRLRAIRRLLPFHKPEYQVLEIEGGSTVKQQVIARYLSAEVRAAAMPSSTVAITPANYRFRYAGSAQLDGSLVYLFQITPRKNRQGLIKGVLWIDAETGVSVRQSGYLVKSPSVFVKRLDVTRQVDLHDGVAEMRVTHLSLDTRLIGRAMLTIRERPYNPYSAAENVPVAANRELSLKDSTR